MSEAAAAGEEGYGGGIGGKFRRRPLRRAPTTPYDRPPAAARGIRSNAVEAASGAAAAVGGRNGWLSKLVDPASRLITRGATRFLSSVFQKRLGAPPAAEAPASSCEPRQDASDLVSTDPLPEIPEQGSKDDSDLKIDCKDDGISELELLLKQKTFTRAEFDHLTELLRSRTVDLLEDAKKAIETGTLLPADDYKNEKVAIISGQKNEIEDSKFLGAISTPAAGLKIPGEEIASPAEVAKAYMGSRPSKMSMSSSSLRNQIIRESTASPNFIDFTTTASAGPVSLKSVNRLPGVPGYPENGYMASRSRGRSAIYKMSRSPYFKGPLTVTLKGSELVDDGFSGPSTSNQLMPMNHALSDDKQGLKRRSSIIESDIGSFGPIRRIRQKSNLASPSKDMTLLFPGKFLPPTNALHNVQTSTFSARMPLISQERKYDTPHWKAAENGDERSCYVSVPPQSSEMARKILQQLDKLVPSPKEKSSEVKPISRHESPPKLTLDMLHGQALKSVADIDSSTVFNVDTNGRVVGPDYSHLGSSVSPKQEKVQENGPSRTTPSELKMASEAKGADSDLVPVADARPTKGPSDSIFPGSAAGPLQKKPAFTMQAPEGLLELEDDNSYHRDTSGSSATGKGKIEASAKEPKIFISEAQVMKKPFPFSSESKVASSLSLSKEARKGVDRLAVADKDTCFTFQVTSPLPQPPLTPTMPSPVVEKSAPLSEQITAPTFTFGSKTNQLTFLTSSTEPTSLKFGAKSDLKGQLFGSVATGTVTTPVESESGKSDTKKPGDLFQSVGATSSSALTTSTTSKAFSFAASTTSSQSNGFLASTSSIFSVSAATPATSLSGSSAGAIISATSASASASYSASIAPSTSPAMAQFGSVSAVSTDSVPSEVKSGSISLGPEPVKESPFVIISSTSTAATPSSVGTGIFGFGASASSSASGTSSSIFGTHETKSGSGTSPFAQSMTSQFGPGTSPSFGLAGSSLGFGSSSFGSSTSTIKPLVSSSGFAQSSTTSSLAVSDSSGPSSSSFAPSATSPSLFGSSSQSTTSSIFGSVFGSSTSTSTMFTPATSSTSSPTTPFGSSSSPLTFTSSAPATSSAFIFTQATTASSPALSFTSFGTSTSSAPLSPAVPAFGMPTATVGFGSGSPGNDQMNVEDSMADDTVQLAMPSIPSFGQPSNVPGPNIPFGSSATPSGAPVFQFGTQPPAFPQSPFQGTGSFEFGGGFSMGSGGGDKAGRRFIKAKRDKHRKK